MPIEEICLVIDGNVANEEKTIREAGIKHTSNIEAYKKPIELIIAVQFRGKKHEFVASEQCTMQQIVAEVLVRLLKQQY